MTRKPEKTEQDELLQSGETAGEASSKHTRVRNATETKRQVFYALEDIRNGKPLARVVGVFLFFLIVANAMLVLFSVQSDLEPVATDVLRGFYLFSTLCFFAEYLCRVWIADLVRDNCTPARARLRYIVSPLGIIDLLSFAPSMISWFLPVTSTVMHAVNVLRLIRLVKVTRYMRGFRTMARVLSKHYQEIVASFLVILIVIIVTCVVMYEVEHAAQPEVFDNLLQSIWFAVQTVTSTGYGDIVPITPVGKVCGMIVMMLALGMIAIPGGIFSAGFVAEFQNVNMRKMEREAASNGSHSTGPSTSNGSYRPDDAGDDADSESGREDRDRSHESESDDAGESDND